MRADTFIEFGYTDFWLLERLRGLPSQGRRQQIYDGHDEMSCEAYDFCSSLCTKGRRTSKRQTLGSKIATTSSTADIILDKDLCLAVAEHIPT